MRPPEALRPPDGPGGPGELRLPQDGPRASGRRTLEELERLIVSAAREVLGTPFVHQGRLPGVGLDCLGTLEHTANRIGYRYEDRADYAWNPDGAELIAALDRYLVRIPLEALVPGCAVLFWVRKPPPHPHEPRHLAIITELGPPVRMLHAHARLSAFGDQGKVEEHELSDGWRKRMWLAYRFPERALEEIGKASVMSPA